MQAGVYEAFTEKLLATVDKLKVGDGLDDGHAAGPLIDDKAVDKIEEHIADAKAKGGKVLTGGKRHALGGTFFEPTVITGATQRHAVREGGNLRPAGAAVHVRHRGRGDRAGQRHEFGLAAYFYTRDLGRVMRVAEALESGMVGVNTGLISTDEAPFGGVKQSGLGREGSHYGLDEFMEMKYICISV